MCFGGGGREGGGRALEGAAADVCGTPTLTVARTDAESAQLITSDIDERDHPFIDRENRTPEGFYRLKPGTGLDHCIARGLSYAKYADLLWWETSHPDLDDAKKFAEAVSKLVVGAGTGGTSATLGRYIRYRRHATRLCVVDPENSSFLPGYVAGDCTVQTGRSSRIEGIGRPRVEPSFISQVIDRMIGVPDAASIAATRHLSDRLGRRVGASTGTNMWGVAQVISEMVAQRRAGSVVSLLCDSGDRYAARHHSPSAQLRCDPGYPQVHRRCLRPRGKGWRSAR